MSDSGTYGVSRRLKPGKASFERGSLQPQAVLYERDD